MGGFIVMRKIGLIGYSGHALVLEDALNSKGRKVFGYFEREKKNYSLLTYLGDEQLEANMEWLRNNDFVVAIGDNEQRSKMCAMLFEKCGHHALSVAHQTSYISSSAHIGNSVQVLTNAVIHPLSKIGNGVVCNTSSVVEHECTVGDFCHISVGTVLCGNVQVGDFSFIGANAVIKQGVKIGRNVIVGAGSVVLRDVPDNSKVVGNPIRFI